jgi:hypothetical protein
MNYSANKVLDCYIAHMLLSYDNQKWSVVYMILSLFLQAPLSVVYFNIYIIDSHLSACNVRVGR